MGRKPTDVFQFPVVFLYKLDEPIAVLWKPVDVVLYARFPNCVEDASSVNVGYGITIWRNVWNLLLNIWK